MTCSTGPPAGFELGSTASVACAPTTGLPVLHTCQTFTGFGFLNARFCGSSLSFMIINEESGKFWNVKTSLWDLTKQHYDDFILVLWC